MQNSITEKKRARNMKRTARSTIALFAVLVFTFTLTVSAGAEGALYTILATGTT